MPWTCPECSDTNKNELIECTCGYEILPQDNVKMGNEKNKNLDILIILFPVAYIFLLFILASVFGSLALFLLLISPVLFFFSVVISIFSIASKKNRLSKAPIIGLLLNSVVFIYSIWLFMSGGIT